MAKLTEDMKEFLAHGRNPLTVFVGTAATDGTPNISAKGTFFRIVDDETLAYADVYSLKTAENLKHNPHVCIAVINSKSYKGYQFKGIGEVLDKGQLVEEARLQNQLVKSVTKVKLSSIYLMDYGHQSGKKVG